jgi:hypothetical protein
LHATTASPIATVDQATGEDLEVKSKAEAAPAAVAGE